MSDKHKVQRPWGGYTILKKTRHYWVKKLFINKGAKLSLQSHTHRTEIWYVLEGSIVAQIGNKEHKAGCGEVLVVPIRREHRIRGIENACVLEIAFGKVLERDIIRHLDDYGRR